MKNRKIHCLNNISPAGTSCFRRGYSLTDSAEEAAGILVRSADMKEMEFSADLRAIARAGAGVNNIPIDRCSEAGIVVFNTPGANANSVKELVIAGMLLGSRDIIGGNEWVREHASDPGIAKAAEKAKKAFPATNAGVCQYEARVAVLHRNIPNQLSQITAFFGNAGLNIANMTSNTRGNYEYTLLDLTEAMPDDTVEKLMQVDGILRVRRIFERTKSEADPV